MELKDKNKILKGELRKISEASGGSIKLGTECIEYKLLDTPFPTLNTIIGGIPRGRFTTVAG
jgi:hypothetical protein